MYTPMVMAVNNFSSTKKIYGNASEDDIITDDLDSLEGLGGPHNHKALAKFSTSL